MYYSLFNFRYEVLTDGLNITKDAFNKIDINPVPENNCLAYYYHFFKAIHSTILADYNEAKNHFEKAEKLLKHYNQEEKKFTLPCLGDTRVRGGSGVYIDIAELGLKQWALVDKVNHRFKGSIHTMDLELII